MTEPGRTVMRNASSSVHCLEAALLTCVLLALPPPVFSIEEPQPQAAPETQPRAARQDAAPSVMPADEAGFYTRLQRVTHHRNLRGLDVPDPVIDALARGEADLAVAALSKLAAAGSSAANVALVRVQHWCGEIGSRRPEAPAEAQARLAKLTAGMPEERAARAARVFAAQTEFMERARIACGRASFDYREIEAQLRQSAEQGDPASATELAKFVRDPAQRAALLEAAAAKDYAPAKYAMATNLLMAVQRGETTQNVSSIRELLKQAGRSIPKAKLDVANCMALGCDGHPADAATAHAFGIDAARDGEPAAFLSMARMPWGGRMPRSELLAWQYFGDRLNEEGCLGEPFISTSATFAQTIQLLEKGQTTETLDSARSQAEALWRSFGERAAKENGCR